MKWLVVLGGVVFGGAMAFLLVDVVEVWKLIVGNGMLAAGVWMIAVGVQE